MKLHRLTYKLLIFLFCFSINNILSISQKPNIPVSFNVTGTTDALPLITVNVSDSEIDEAKKIKDVPYVYAVYAKTDIAMTDGVYDTVAGTGVIWRIKIASKNAFSIGLRFADVEIPEDASILIYNHSKDKICGPFTGKQKSFMSGDIPGDTIIIEYFEPENAFFSGKFKIIEVGHAFRDIFSSSLLKSSSEEFVDVNCPLGDNYQDIKHSVCRISLTVGQYAYLCSGALINNTRNDGTPYFLTASHCISQDSVAETVIVYFNYENETCNGSIRNYSTIYGAKLISYSKETDFSLIKLNETPTPEMQPYYAGWNANKTLPEYSVNIHHPGGEPKKINIDYDKASVNLYSINWVDFPSSPKYSHLAVKFDAGGGTIGGSSGSPLFNKNKLIVGQLHGGTTYDYFGRISMSWDSLSNSINQLKTWLDPDNSGVKELDGYSPASYPDARFIVQTNWACVANPVNLYDKSTGNPTQWKWLFSPSSVTFTNSTSSTSQNPVVTFDNPGIYTITLIASNAYSSDTIVKEKLVSANYDLNVTGTFINGPSVCIYDDAIIELSGANTYGWYINPSPYSNYVSIDSQSVNLIYVSLNSEAYKISDSAITISLGIFGAHGSCKDTNNVNIVFKHPANDNIINAIALSYGKNGPFSNICGTIEEYEPHPPITSCTTQYSWCDEYRDGQNIIENTIWFTFTGPSTGKISIMADEFDSEIAIYDAISESNIMSGLPGLYTIIAANDDASETNPVAIIQEATVVPGKKYWLQLDGSGGGTQDTTIIYISDSLITNNPFIYKENYSLSIYPNPNNGRFNIFLLNKEINELNVEIYNINGSLVYSGKHLHSGIIPISLNNPSPGVYILKIKGKNGTSINKINVL